MALSAYTTAAVASNTGVPLSDDDKAGIEGIVNTGQRGANLFAVNVPGETFSELSGTLGHSAIDISLTGNTPLSYHLRRDFEEIPNAYPYALGNMSIRTPHLSINTNLGKIDWKFAYSTVSRNQDHANFSCQNLTAANNTTHSWAIRPQSASIELFNDVELVHEMGSTKLLPKHLIYPPLISKFPDDTVLASNDGWYMKCGSLNPDLFEVHRPDGTVYTFDHTASIEQRSSKRVVPATWLTSDGIRTSGRSDSYFNVYRLNAKSISRLDASIQFIYETSPELNVSGQVHLQRVHAPLSHYGASNIIVNKQRLKTVLLRYKHPAGGDRVNSLHFNYRANNANHCPGLLNSVNAAGRYRTARVRYLYEGLGGTIHDNKIGTPMSKCILAKVEEDPVNYSSGTGWLPKWEFEYGFTIVGDPTDHGYYYKGVGYSNDAKTDWNEKIDDFAYLPLKKVTVPTGASVNYEYVIEYPCRYQPITGYGPVSSAACSEYKPKRPSLAKRSVVSHSDDETTFNYLSEVVYELPTHSEIKRTIKNGRTPQRHEHVLTFKRILRGGTDSYPGGPNPEIDEALRDNGKLMSHEIKNSSGSILQIANYTYKENASFHSWVDAPMRKPGFQIDDDHRRIRVSTPKWQDNRRFYRFDHRRNNPFTVTVTKYGRNYTTEYSQYDGYNNPITVVDTSGVNGSAPEYSRTTTYTYDNNFANKSVWFVGHKATETIEADNNLDLINTYGYNAVGLLTSKSEAGISSTYGYTTFGLPAWTEDGDNNRTEFLDYWEGVPRQINYPDGGLMTRTVDNWGNILTETERLDGSQSITRTYEYGELYRKKSRDIGHDGAADVVYDYPTWNWSASHKPKNYVSTGQGFEQTTFDSLGRGIRTQSLDLSPYKSSYQSTRYDSEFGLPEYQTPFVGNTSINEGTQTFYDAFGRIDSILHLKRPSRSRFCYGPFPCNIDSTFNVPGAAVSNGYSVVDPDGNASIYNYRQIGARSKPELTSIHRQVDPLTHYEDNDVRQSTFIERNNVGFVTSITQGNGGSNTLQRTFTPQSRNGSTSLRVESETHPEFGTRTITSVDGNANPTVVKNFDGSNINYQYDAMNRPTNVDFPGSASGMVQPTGDISFVYYDNGLVETASQNAAGLNPATSWLTEYNDNGLVEKETLSVDSQQFALGYTYDALLNIDSVTYPTGRVVDFGRNGMGQVTSVTGLLDTASYHHNGMLANYELSNGESFTATQTNDYKPNLWIGYDSDNNAIYSFDYNYTAGGNISSIGGYLTASGQSLTGLEYDGLNRLAKATLGSENYEFSYDVLDNINKRTLRGTELTYTYNTSGVLTSATPSVSGALPSYSMTYDGNGNVTDTSFSDYRYDHLNRLITASTPAGDQTNTYDASNMRVKSTQTSGQARSTYFVYNHQGQLMHELDTATDEARDHVYFNGKRLATYGVHNHHDSDRDGIPDYFERLQGLDPYIANTASSDADGDGRKDVAEYITGLLPSNTDSDGDGVSDATDSDSIWIPALEDEGGVILEPIYQFIQQ